MEGLRFLFTVFVSLISIVFLRIHFTETGSINLTPVIWIPSNGILLLILLNKFTQKINYLLQFITVLFINAFVVIKTANIDLFYSFYWFKAGLWEALQTSFVLSFISFYVFINIYTLFLHYKTLKWPNLIYLNSIIGVMLLVKNRIYGSGLENSTYLIIIISMFFYLFRSRRAKTAPVR